jgi:hypothetical protein
VEQHWEGTPVWNESAQLSDARLRSRGDRAEQDREGTPVWNESAQLIDARLQSAQ